MKADDKPDVQNNVEYGCQQQEAQRKIPENKMKKTNPALPTKKIIR